MNKKKIIIVSLILLITLIIVIVLLLPSNEKQDLEAIENNTEEAVKLFLNPKADIKQIAEETGIPMTDYNVIVGDDSYLKTKLDEKILNKYDLSEYQKAQEKYATEIETRFLESIEYNLGEAKEINADEAVQTVTVKGYYYELYLTDLMELSTKILKESGYDLSKLEKDEKIEVAYYKAKVKAMQVMSNHKEEYDNHSEKLEFELIYKDGKPKNSDEMLTLLLNIKGMTYDNMDFSDEKNIEAHQKRVDSYFSEINQSGEDILTL